MASTSDFTSLPVSMSAGRSATTSGASAGTYDKSNAAFAGREAVAFASCAHEPDIPGPDAVKTKRIGAIQMRCVRESGAGFSCSCRCSSPWESTERYGIFQFGAQASIS